MAMETYHAWARLLESQRAIYMANEALEDSILGTENKWLKSIPPNHSGYRVNEAMIG